MSAYFPVTLAASLLTTDPCCQAPKISFPQSFMEGSKSLLPFGEPEALETKMGWEVQGFSDCQWPSEGSRLPRDLVYV